MLSAIRLRSGDVYVWNGTKLVPMPPGEIGNVLISQPLLTSAVLARELAECCHGEKPQACERCHPWDPQREPMPAAKMPGGVLATRDDVAWFSRRGIGDALVAFPDSYRCPAEATTERAGFLTLPIAEVLAGRAATAAMRKQIEEDRASERRTTRFLLATLAVSVVAIVTFHLAGWL